MRKKLTSSNLFLSQLTMGIIIGIILMAILFSVGQIAYAEGNDEEKTTLNKYLLNEYRNEMSFDEPNRIINVSGDDNIVEYVPKEHFMQEGQHLYMGDDYGYYIYTFPDGKFENSSYEFTSFGNKRSIVLGFEIKYEQVGDISEARDSFSIEVKPLFQREYATLMPDGINEVGIGDYSKWQESSRDTINFRKDVFTNQMTCVLADGVDKNSGLVFPVPHYELSSGDFYFDDVDVFYLTDLVVSASIENAQDLNEGDAGYTTEADNGCFMIGTGFELSALEYVVEDADLNGLLAYSADAVLKKAVSTVLGFIPGGELIAGALDIHDYLHGAKEYFGGDHFEQTTDSSYYGTVDIPNSKYAQLQQSGHLYRAASMKTQNGGGADLWFGNGNSFKAYFEVGSGAVNEASWWTVANHSVSLSVKSLFDDLTSLSGGSLFYGDFLNKIRKKPISEDAAIEAYVRGNDGDIEGKDSFAFTAPRNGLYEVSLTNGTGVDYIITDSADTIVYEPISGGMYYFEEGQKYIIELTNTTSSLKRPTVKVGMATLEASVGDSIELTLPAGAVVGLKVNFEDAFADVTITGDNARIYGLTANGFMPEEGAYTTNLDQIGSGIKYLWVENSAGQAQTVTITFADIPLVLSGTGGTYAFDGVGEDYYTVVKFDLDDSYIYCLELTMSVSEASPDFIVYNSDGVINTANRTPSADNKRFTYLLNVGSGAGYLAVRGGGTYTVGMSTSGEAGDWYINGELVSTYSYDGYGAVILEQFDDKNAEYTVQYITKSGTIINELNYIGDNVGIDFNPSSGIITITPNSPYTRQNVYFTRNGNVANPLKLTFAVRRGPGFYFEYTRTPLMLKLHYDASSPLDEVTLTAGTHTYTFDCAGKNGVIDLSSQIKTDFYDAFVLSATFAVSSYTMLYSESATYTQHPGGHLGDAFALVSYDTGLIPYAGGNGLLWNPYQITTRAELEYMGKHNQALASYALMNDIDLSGANWTPIPTFSGILLGNGHAITNMRIHIADTSDTLQRYGFIGVNEGMIYGLTFKNAYITAGNLHYTGWVDVGIVAGYNEATINECSVNGTLEIHRNNSNIGGIVGENAGTVSTCKFGELHSSKVMGNGEIGGIAGKNTSVVSTCQVFNTEINFWEVYQGRSIGGIVGYNPDGTITDCGILNSKFIFSGYDDGENAWLPNFGYIAGAMEGDSRLVRVGKTDDVTYDFSAVVPNDVVPFVKNWFKGGWGETGYRADTVYVE